MPTHEPETLTDSKTPATASDVRSARADGNSKPASAKSATPRRRRDRQEIPKINLEERFFLADGDGNGDVPALGRECPNEADAIIEAFRAKVNFYKISEFQTRADIGPSGEPILRKEAFRKSNPAS